MSNEKKAASGSQLRHLLPATKWSAGSAAKSSKSSRLKQVSAACIPCRKQKLKCTGERPACQRCIQRHLECQYTTRPGETEAQARNRVVRDLRSREAINERLIDLLKNLPDKDAEGVLQRLRAGMDAASIVSQAEDVDLLVQLAVTPETRFRYEFPYRPEMPAGYLTDNPYLDSLVYEASFLQVADQSRQDFADQKISETPEDYSDLYLKPFHAAEVRDPLLTSVKISQWTSVCDDDALMRDILSWWLRCEYHFTTAFQKDLFLEDMAALRGDFCSSLLVNITLGYACVCFPRFQNRAKYWEPHTLMYRFIAEARRLWELEAAQPRITTIQAGILFNVYYNLCGLDEVGQSYRIHSIALAQNMCLFDKEVISHDVRVHHGRAFTAWAVFNWETLVGFSFNFAPLLSKPPAWHLPEPSEDAKWYGEVWLKYPLGKFLVPSNFGPVFKARCDFRVIMNEACQAMYCENSDFNLASGSLLLLRLQSWYNGLPGALQPRKIVLPGHLQLHMYYYHLILTIFEPMLNAAADPQPFLEQIVVDAKKRHHTLVRLYYLRHGYDAMDLFIVIPLMLVASECIDVMNERTPTTTLETLRSTLILVVKGLYNQRRNHYLANALFRVIRGRMRSSEVSLFRRFMDMNDTELEEKPDMTQAVRSSWPVSIVKKREDIKSHILTTLVENYAHLNVEGPSEGDIEEGKA